MLLIVSADPRRSGRAAEAVRVAAGLAAIGELGIEVCFCQAAALILSRPPATLVDGETIASSLPVLERHACALWAESGDPFLEGDPRANYRRISLEELLRLARRHQQVLRF